MKKINSFILMIVLSLSLVACGKSDEVKNVENLISGIGTVTFDSEDQIKSAESAYEALPDDDKGKVSNYNTLLEAQEKYDSLGIKLSLDNYEKYLDVSCNRTLGNPIDYATAMGIDKKIGQNVYRSITLELSVNGISGNYDYNDVVVSARITGYYMPETMDGQIMVNQKLITYEDYMKSQLTNIDVTLTANANIIGVGTDAYTINLASDEWMLDTALNMGFEVIDVSGTMTPVGSAPSQLDAMP